MGVKGVEFRMALVVCSVLVLWNIAAAQSGCTSALVSLSPCLSYVDGNSSTPSSSCCSQLSDVVQSHPLCLCLLLNGSGSSLGITVNKTLALALPGACSVETPPVSKCNGKAAGASAAGTSAPIQGPASAPVGSPAESPADSTDDAAAMASDSVIPSEGSKTVPTSGVSSIGITMKSTLNIAILLVVVISSASAATGF